ncbi:dapper homolog 1 isoform X2 [Synchiropus splendidus]|uniref:dapper homolog 1 isoform X2 n=1 Tax=Synchiropus splendidus TaxID=270530 RepID=UPI00237E265D|nr:dapper homolog 1 isoform X2 [Synchiropus splendidus]
MPSGTARRDVAADAAVRERLEAAVCGISELDQRRQRQEVLVRAALELREESESPPLKRSSEEKLLEENILLLRKQLSCLRRRDAGLISQLQELDRQISDLRLDTEEPCDRPEADSRPSSGFYELSDAASGSLSNSSNSVFSECFCSAADADGRSPCAEQLSCLECEDLPASGPVRRSHSAPQPPSPGAFTDARVQVGGLWRSGDVLDSSPTLVPPSSSWPPPRTAPLKRLDSYIYGLLQRRAQPVRPGRPRTSISTEPSKGGLRPGGMCARHLCGPSHSAALGALRASPQRQVSVESQDHHTSSGFHSQSPATEGEPRLTGDEDKVIQSSSLLRRSVEAPAAALESPRATSCPQEALQSSVPAKIQASSLRSRQPDAAKKKVLKVGGASEKRPADGAGTSVPAEALDGPGATRGEAGRRSKSQSSRHGSAASEPRGCSKSSGVMENGGPTFIRASKPATAGASSRYRQLPASIPEGRAVKRHAAAALSGEQSRQRVGRRHSREQTAVLAKPKHKRSDHRRLPRPRRGQQPALQGAACWPVAPSDSEYSAECASLFHSTIVDSSEDECSNYSTNCFGDSESSQEDEASSSGGTEQSAGRRRPAGASTQARTVVKIKASRNLKRKILRFRSGSLKLMTTV